MGSPPTQSTTATTMALRFRRSTEKRANVQGVSASADLAARNAGRADVHALDFPPPSIGFVSQTF
jgi:hypothetical protein